jgi:hypothetical protein
MRMLVPFMQRCSLALSMYPCALHITNSVSIKLGQDKTDLAQESGLSEGLLP